MEKNEHMIEVKIYDQNVVNTLKSAGYICRQKQYRQITPMISIELFDHPERQTILKNDYETNFHVEYNTAKAVGEHLVKYKQGTLEFTTAEKERYLSEFSSFRIQNQEVLRILKDHGFECEETGEWRSTNFPITQDQFYYFDDRSDVVVACLMNFELVLLPFEKIIQYKETRNDARYIQRTKKHDGK